MIESFFVAHNGQQIEFSPLFEAGVLKGYTYRCPVGTHRSFNWIDTESGERHHFEFDSERRATITGSLECPQKDCTWHVRVDAGVAKEC